MYKCSVLTLFMSLFQICKVKIDAHLATGDVYYTSKCEDPQVCLCCYVFSQWGCCSIQLSTFGYIFEIIVFFFWSFYFFSVWIHTCL